MSNVSRRNVVKYLGLSAAAAPFFGLLNACTSDGAAQPAGSASSGSNTTELKSSSDAAVSTVAIDTSKVGKVKVALSSSTIDTYLVQRAGPLMFGSDFGLDIKEEDIIGFDSHATAVQTALAGSVNIVGASTVGNLAVIAQGAPFKIFQPYSLLDDFVIATVPSIKTFQQLKDEKPVIGIDSAGGAARTIMDAIFMSNNTGFTVNDLENVQNIESSGGRTSALASGQIQVTSIHKGQVDQIMASGVEVNILATLYDSTPMYLKESFAAPEAWLAENKDTAAAFAASVIKASRVLSTDVDAFIEACHTVLKEPPSDENLKADFELISSYTFWPAETTGLEPERLDFMIDLAEREGMLAPGVITSAKAIDSAPSEAAMAYLS